MSKKILRDFYVNYHREKKKYERESGGIGGMERSQLLKKLIGTGKKILDLGCRDGSLTRYYIDGNEVVGADVDDIALSICSKDLGIKTYHIDLNEDFPFEDSAFDVVVAAEIIEHVAMPTHFVKEVSRVLKHDGIFYGTTPNAYRLKTRFEFLFGKPLCDDYSHLQFFLYDSLSVLLQEYFNIIDIIPFRGHIIGNNNLGIPVTQDSSVIVTKLFSRHLVWKARK